MRITPVASQPNFCAKLKNNDTVKEFMQLATTDQLKEFRKGLEELDKYNKKDVIEIKRNETNDGYVVTNLTNKNTKTYTNHYDSSYSDYDSYQTSDSMWLIRNNNKQTGIQAPKYNPENEKTNKRTAPLKYTDGDWVKYSFLEVLDLSKNSETLFGDLKSQYMNSINSMLQKGTTPKASKTKVDTKA